MAQVINNVKFSYNLIKGSVKKREEFVSNLNEQFFNALVPVYKKNKITLTDIKREYFSLLPEKKVVKIKPLNAKFKLDGASDYIYIDNSIAGITLEMPLKHSILPKDSFVTFMHENTHVLDTLANPKHTALTLKLFQENKYDNKRNKWFDNIIYNREPINKTTKENILLNIKNQTQNFLKGKQIEDKIAILQDARYQLEQEKHAYSEQLKYALKLKAKNMPVTEKDLVDESKNFLFDEKIQLLKEITFNLISKERKKLAKKLEK